MMELFRNVGEICGLQVWRVEGFTLVLQAAEEHGKFYTGDSYVILNTVGTSKCFSYNVHYWLGSKTSQNKYTAAAIFAVQLREQLGAALLDRELQNEESEKFKSYFSTLNYLQGGTKDVKKIKLPEKMISKKLYELKGKTILKMEEIDFDRTKIVDDGIYILDAYNNVYVFINKEDCRKILGPQTTALAKQLMNRSFCPAPKLIILDAESNEAEKSQFFNEFRYRYVNEEDITKTSQSEAAPTKKKCSVWLLVVFFVVLMVLFMIFHWQHWLQETRSYSYIQEQTTYFYTIYLEPTISYSKSYTKN